MAKQRVDQVLVDQGLFPSREQAKRAVMAGIVFIGDKRIDKPGTGIDPRSELYVKGQSLAYVSRGGLKLAKALDKFDLDVSGQVVMDVGASTGGFTDCLLQNGATKVYAIDVGYGQLHWTLRQDPRVVVMERTNVRYLATGDLPELPNMATIDVAFISLTKFFHSLLNLLTNDGQIVALIKPQFEAGREFVGKKGVVRDPDVHIRVINHLMQVLQDGVGLVGLTYSPIKGPEGNIEYLAHFHKGQCKAWDNSWAETVVRSAFEDTQ